MHADRSPDPPTIADDPAGPGAAAVVLPALAAALAAAVLIDFRPDDLFIYLRMARNAAEGLGWGFNPSEPVNVASSAAWLWVLVALGHAGALTPMTAQLAGGFMMALAVGGTASLAGRLAQDRRAAWAAGIVLAADAWMTRWFWSGMETGLAIALVVWALAVRTTARPGGRRDAASGLLLALVPLARPELAVVPVAALAAGALEAPRHGWGRVVRDAAALGFVGAAWIGWSLPVWGSVLPATAIAKGTLGSVNISMLDALARVATVVVSTQAIALAAAALGAWLWARRAAPTSERALGRREVVRTIVFFAAALALLYSVQHVRVYTRYVLPLTAVIVALGMAAIVELARGRDGRVAMWLRVGPVAASLLLNLVLSSALVIPKTRQYARSMREVVIPLAERLAAETPADARIAVPDIGAMGYFTERYIVDLNGLATPEVVPYKRAGRLADYLREHPPDVLIGIEPEPRRWPERVSGLGLTEQGVYRFDGMFVRGPDPMYLTVYRVAAPRDGPGGSGPAGGGAGQ